ncbi:helix-turn-helix domain-containing protein [Thiovibrio frasassiensis]|uniref:helix-turn-helix domain-containing protein n=1 Tax=Thiovibrio frasassiensis TaxID=2984131 RepID=UPI003530CE3B
MYILSYQDTYLMFSLYRSVLMPQAKLISVKDAAAMTGMSQQWWRGALAGRRPMPPVRVVRIGRAIRLHLDDLEVWINQTNGQNGE